MAKLNSRSDKTEMNSASNGTAVKNAKTKVRRDSTNGKIVEKNNSKNSMSEADQLTFRAWKKTFENRKKAA